MNLSGVAPGAVLRNGFLDPSYRAAVGVDHLGADLAVPVGTPVRSPVAGEVVFAGWDDASGDGGVGVKLAADGDGSSVGFWHLSQAAAALGQHVSAGDVVGYSGQSGNAVYPHVHLQVELPPGHPIDPVAWLAQLGGGGDVVPVGGGSSSGASGWIWLAVAAAALVLLRPRD